MNHEEGRREREARSVALERAYVHDVYDQISTQIPESQSRPWPCVRKFMEELEPGSLVADVGCGTGQYLQIREKICTIGVERCASMAHSSKHLESQLMIADNTCLPFRDESFDACISIAVIHHFATTERRVCALRELARILRIGGRLMISVWAMEQRNRKQFDSQDVLVPWHRPLIPCDNDSPVRDPISDEDEDVCYCSQLDNPPIFSRSNTIEERGKSKKGESGIEIEAKKCQDELLLNIESYQQQGQDMTSPKQSCYSFVRRALQKLTSGRKSGCRSYSLHGQSLIRNSEWSTDLQFDGDYPYECDAVIEDSADDIPIELRHLEPDDPDLLASDNYSFLYDSNNEERNMSANTFTPYLASGHQSSISDSSSKVRLVDSSTEDSVSNVIRSKSSSSCLSLSSRTNVSSPVSTSGVSAHSSDSNKGHESRSTDSGLDEESFRVARKRPTLRKQKASITEPETTTPVPIESSKKVPLVTLLPKPTITITKQTSLHDEMIYIDRFLENEKLKQSLPKQYSLNEDLIYGQKQNIEPSISFKLFKKRFVQLKTIRERFQKLKSASLERFDIQSPVIFKGGVSKLLTPWKTEVPADGEQPKLGALDPNKILTSANTIWNEINNACSNFSQKYKSDSVSESKSNDKPETKPNPHNYFDVVNREIRLSKEESSDSSKDSSFQSDTSLDSEDSCISVIFVPNPSKNGTSSLDKERHRSISSESSEGSDKPNSPKSPKSPGNCPSPRYFASNKYLSSKVNRLPTLKQSQKTIGGSLVELEGRIGPTLPDDRPLSNPSTPSLVIADSSSNKEPLVHIPMRFTFKEKDDDVKTEPFKTAPKVMEPTVESQPHQNKDLNATKLNDPEVKKHIDEDKKPKTEDIDKSEFSRFDAISLRLQNKPRASYLKTNTLSGTIKTKFHSPSLEVFNPEIDDVDSDCSSSSSSPSGKSGNSVIELGWPTEKEIEELDKEIKRKEIEKQNMYSYSDVEFYLGTEDYAKPSLVEPVHRMDTINEEHQPVDNGASSRKILAPCLSPSSKPFHSHSLESLLSRPNLAPFSELRNLALNNRTRKYLDSSCGLSRRLSEASSADTVSEGLKITKKTNNTTVSSDSSRTAVKSRTGRYNSLANSSLDSSHRRSDVLALRKFSLNNKPLSKSTGNIRTSSTHSLLGEKVSSQNPSYSKSLHRSDETLSDQSIQLTETSARSPFSSHEGSLTKMTHSSCLHNLGSSFSGDHSGPECSSWENFSLHSNIDSSSYTLSSSGSNASLPNDRCATRKLSPKLENHSSGSSSDIKCVGDNNKELPRGKTKEQYRDWPQGRRGLTVKNYSGECPHCKKRSYKDICQSLSDSSQYHPVSGESSQSSTSSKLFQPLDSLNSLRSKDSLDPKEEDTERCTSLRSDSLSHSTASPCKMNTKSQESLQSDVGGSPTLHRYYHVFREGELDQLIHKYVHNLHIISSYYDHASWCIVAEKVQVWTI